MHPIASTAGLLVLSNIFMTFAWYAHLRDLGHRPWV
ncbi:MAG: DMT family protein, partial [Alphaproteobacteria bacterium]